MAARIALVQGHPDRAGAHLCHALADAYARGAAAAGHEVRRIDVAALDFPLLRDPEDFEHGAPPPDIVEAQETIRWAQHIVLVYPLWLGTMPALLKAFLEQVFRPSFAFARGEGRWPASRLKGRSARIVVSMGMPALVYRWYFGAHGLRNLERNILGFGGIRPVRAVLLGMAGAPGEAKAARWLARMERLGRAAR